MMFCFNAFRETFTFYKFEHIGNSNNLASNISQIFSLISFPPEKDQLQCNGIES